MRTMRLLLVTAFMLTLFAVGASAQAAKFGVINTSAFGAEKEGITRYVAAVTALNAEFTPLNTEIRTMATKLQGLAKEIEDINKLIQQKPDAVDRRAAQAKVDEAEKLDREIKFKQEEGKARFEKRQAAVLSPIMGDIFKAVQEYAKSKGLTMVFDLVKLEESGALLGLDEKSDITKEFITFYNARPAATTAATPK